MSSNWNPGNFANRPQEEVEDLASKGGQHSHQGGFANMDPSKQVFYITLCLFSLFPFLFWTRLTSVTSEILLLRVARCPVGTNNRTKKTNNRKKKMIMIFRDSRILVRGNVSGMAILLVI